MESSTQEFPISRSVLLDKHQSLWQIILEQFLRHKMAMVGLGVIVLFVLLAIGAPLIQHWTGINPYTQNVFNRYLPPFSTVEFTIDQKEEALETFIENAPDAAHYLQKLVAEANLVEASIPAEDVLFEIIPQLSYHLSEGLFKNDSHLAVKSLKELDGRFSTYHFLGTDELGRDLFMRLLFGTRVSILVGVLVALVSMIMGLFLGAFAGFYGGWIDIALSRLIDAMLSLPLLPLMIVFAAVDFKQFKIFLFFTSSEHESIFKLIFILCLFSWMKVARVVRGAVLSLKEREFVLAAKTIGLSSFQTILIHIIPNVAAPLLVAVTLNVGEAILSEAALSFLGLGISPPTPSWGNILFNAMEQLHHSPFLSIAPGVLILLTVVSFNFVGDGLQDAIDPKAIKR